MIKTTIKYSGIEDGEPKEKTKDVWLFFSVKTMKTFETRTNGKRLFKAIEDLKNGGTESLETLINLVCATYAELDEEKGTLKQDDFTFENAQNSEWIMSAIVSEDFVKDLMIEIGGSAGAKKDQPQKG